MTKRFPYKPGTEVRIFWKDASVRTGTLPEVKKEGLVDRTILGRYLGCTDEAFIICSDYCKDTETQDCDLVPRTCVYKIEKV